MFLQILLTSIQELVLKLRPFWTANSRKNQFQIVSPDGFFSSCLRMGGAPWLSVGLNQFICSLCVPSVIVISCVGHSGWSPFYVLDIVLCMLTQNHGSVL